MAECTGSFILHKPPRVEDPERDDMPDGWQVARTPRIASHHFRWGTFGLILSARRFDDRRARLYRLLATAWWAHLCGSCAFKKLG
jgi:hypothetical protein